MGPLLAYFIPVLWNLYFSVIILYVLLLTMSIHNVKSVKVWILTFMGIIATHVGYGICFIRGLCSNKLIR